MGRGGRIVRHVLCYLAACYVAACLYYPTFALVIDTFVYLQNGDNSFSSFRARYAREGFMAGIIIIFGLGLVGLTTAIPLSFGPWIVAAWIVSRWKLISAISYTLVGIGTSYLAIVGVRNVMIGPYSTIEFFGVIQMNFSAAILLHVSIIGAAAGLTYWGMAKLTGLRRALAPPIAT